MCSTLRRLWCGTGEKKESEAGFSSLRLPVWSYTSQTALLSVWVLEQRELGRGENKPGWGMSERGWSRPRSASQEIARISLGALKVKHPENFKVIHLGKTDYISIARNWRVEADRGKEQMKQQEPDHSYLLPEASKSRKSHTDSRLCWEQASPHRHSPENNPTASRASGNVANQ